MKKSTYPAGASAPINQTLADFAFERNLKPRAEVSLSIFSYLFSEIVQQLMKNEKSGGAGGGVGADHPGQNDLEHQLYQLGVPVGEKLLELLFYREKGGQSGACSQGKRETKLVSMLHFINNQVWKALFGHQADGLEQSIEDEDEYRLLDKQPVTNKYTSIGKGQHVNCASYIAGIIEGILTSSKMHAKVTAHLYNDEEAGGASGAEAQTNPEEASTTIYVIKFSKEAIARDKGN